MAHGPWRAPVDPIRLPPLFADVHRGHRRVMAFGAAKTHADRFARHPDDYPPRIRGLIEEGLGVTFDELYEIELLQIRLHEQFDLGFPHPLLTPATLDPAPGPDTTGDAWCNSPWSLLGVPTVSLPLGRTADGLPLAVQLVGGENREDALLARAAWLEQVYRLDKRMPGAGLPPVPG